MSCRVYTHCVGTCTIVTPCSLRYKIVENQSGPGHIQPQICQAISDGLNAPHKNYQDWHKHTELAIDAKTDD